VRSGKLKSEKISGMGLASMSHKVTKAYASQPTSAFETVGRPLRGSKDMTRPSSLQGCIYKVNCVARQGESPIGERKSPGGEGALGGSVSLKLTSADFRTQMTMELIQGSPFGDASG